VRGGEAVQGAVRFRDLSGWRAPKIHPGTIESQIVMPAKVGIQCRCGFGQRGSALYEMQVNGLLAFEHLK
jgi:hypothetical protein